jgi:hypothetical protein
MQYLVLTELVLDGSFRTIIDNKGGPRGIGEKKLQKIDSMIDGDLK